MVSFNKVIKYYGENPAVQGVTCSVNPGELFGLIGPDGAGKSTLFRMLTTLILPDSGEILFNQRDVVNAYKYVRANVGYMPGTFSLYADLTVEENLQFFATLYGTTVEKNYVLIRDIYEQIEPFKDRRAQDLSGGMKQKLALSCALIHRPMVLVLDEPTTGVDAVSRKEFWTMLERLKNDGLTILVSTAYMDEATLCDRVGLIQDGKLMSVDTPSGVLASFPWKLMAVQSDKSYRLLTILKKSDQFRHVHPFGDSVHVSLEPSSSEDQLVGYLDQHLKNSYKIRQIKPVIEDCFMELMLSNANG